MSGETPTTPVNFWTDMPEEEYYASQGVRSSKSYFGTTHDLLGHGRSDYMGDLNKTASALLCLFKNVTDTEKYK